MTEEEFRMVTRKKWMARKSLQRRQRKISDRSYNADCPEIDVDKFLERLKILCTQMKTSDYFTQAMSTLEESLSAIQLDNVNKLERLVCFGIGPFTRNFQALHQLAFILCAQRYCGIAEAIYFDPVLRDSEKTVLEQLECKLMTENCEAKYEADVLTLFYLPHCPNCLTNNLLWSNWRPRSLQNAIIINNSFESLVISKPERLLRVDSGYILDILSYVKEFALEDDYETHNIFNDLAVHVFPAAAMPDDKSEFWLEREAPKYKDVEMISADDFAKLSIT